VRNLADLAGFPLAPPPQEQVLVILQKRVARLSAEALDRFVRRARLAVGLRGRVNVLVTGSRDIRGLNRRFRDLDKATDVLSFPAQSLVEQSRRNISRAATTKSSLAGEIAISADIAAQNAARLRHLVADEIRILTLHGILHLAGFDHERDNGEMARKEIQLRRRFGLPSGLIERTHTGRQATVGRKVYLPHSPKTRRAS
jgi:probable rRNA maturation factor